MRGALDGETVKELASNTRKTQACLPDRYQALSVAVSSQKMTAIELRVDDRVILVSAIAACAGYVLLQWHRSQFEWRRAPKAAANDSDAKPTHDDPNNTEAAWVSRLLEQQFARESAQEAPFADLPLVQVRLQHALKLFPATHFPVCTQGLRLSLQSICPKLGGVC